MLGVHNAGPRGMHASSARYGSGAAASAENAAANDSAFNLHCILSIHLHEVAKGSRALYSMTPFTYEL